MGRVPYASAKSRHQGGTRSSSLASTSLVVFSVSAPVAIVSLSRVLRRTATKMALST
ncbi:uncharacterized protein TRAVEDRAFT_31602 [Trametes versicolor FP-101664 SS1]|uniref:uncharacterized protein n=1 Tax=Trametes versicolor (strain FP-101664) TaxID=717944 RepID=UPI000462366D|nr:uncharacterized protein TRAVEDRAFT_31602 [Trametes versicolor FP-101664 SS1]EIW53441.1 hypothetical protein TRAVEDRAFT_31602 [Trametes versicolor FP-101664 SS1]